MTKSVVHSVMVITLCLVTWTSHTNAQTIPARDIVRHEQLNARSGFPRYRIGNECVQTLTWTENQFWRAQRPDTISYAREGNPSQRSSVDAVNQCLASLNLMRLAQRDLLGLGMAYLAGEQYDQADATLKKLAASATLVSVPVRAWTLYQIVNIYLDAAQPKLANAENYVTQLDAMGRKAAAERMLAHTHFAAVAAARDSVPLREREITAALRASQELRGDDRKEYAPEMALVYFGLADLQARKGDPVGAIATVNAGRAVLAPLRSSITYAFDAQTRWYTLIGRSAPKIQATQWFNRGADTIRPVPGKINVIVFVSHSCRSACYAGYGILRRLVHKFGDTVAVTMVARTEGYFRTRLVTPDSEFVKTNTYLSDFLKLPGALGIWKTDFGHGDDGRLIVMSAPNEDAYRLPPVLLPVYIVDRQGTVRFVSKLSRDNDRSHDTEVILEDEITSLL